MSKAKKQSATATATATAPATATAAAPATATATATATAPATATAAAHANLPAYIVFNGGDKKEFARAIFTAYNNGQYLKTPAGRVIPPIVAEGGSVMVTFDEEGGTMRRVGLNKVFSAIRAKQKEHADGCHFIRQFKTWVTSYDVLTLGEDEKATFYYDLLFLNSKGASIDCVRLIRQYITSAMLSSREAGVSSAFYYHITEIKTGQKITKAMQFSASKVGLTLPAEGALAPSDLRILEILVKGSKATFTKDERATWLAINPVHTGK